MKEKVTFKNSRNQKLVGILSEPKYAKAAILLISGYASGKEEWGNWMVHYADSLNKAGFATLRFDRAGIGESEGDFVESTIESEAEDCVAACRFLKNKYRNIAASGHSMGGALVIMLASRVKLKAVIASSPSAEPAKTFRKVYTEAQIKELEEKGKLKMPADWENFGIKYIGLKYWEARKSFDIKKYVTLAKAPTLIVYGTADKYVDITQIDLFFSALACKKELKIFENASHGFKPLIKQFHELATEWFKKYLK